MKEFCFIVLHYAEKSIIDTFECVDSILQNIQSDNYQIVIIENGSSDNSEYRLNEKYKDMRSIDIIISKENLGFAKGNNLGCIHAIEKYKPNFLIVINNDTLINQKNFLDLIAKEYKTNEFDILGPNILDKYKRPQNPIINGTIETLERLNNEIYITQKMLMQYERKITINRIYIVMLDAIKKNRLSQIIIKKLLQNKKINNISTVANWQVPLHGSALVFSKRYYNRYNNTIFYPGTFLYAEEDILFYISKRDNLLVRYQPKLEIFHKEDASTNSIVRSGYEKRKFIYKNKLFSLIEFKKLILNDQNNK